MSQSVTFLQQSVTYMSHCDLKKFDKTLALLAELELR